MELDVGPFTYTVRLVRDAIEHEGEACFGLCDHLNRTILISDALDPTQRLHVLLHELFHAWQRHCPARLDDEEAVADLVALSMTRLAVQLKANPHLLDELDAPAEPTEAACGTSAGAPTDEALRVRKRIVVPPDPEDPHDRGWVVRVFEPETEH